MGNANGSESASDRSKLRKIIVAAVLILITAGAISLLYPVIGFLEFVHDTQGTSRVVSSADAGDSVAESLMRWGLFGAVPNRDPEYTNLRRRIASGIHSIRGFSESDGFHGDGTDWYELELGASFADDLRMSLGATAGISESKSFSHEATAPQWWPGDWPADAQCYRKNFEYLVLPDSGTKAWFMRLRT